MHIKKRLGQIRRDFSMLKDYCIDFSKYRKYNFSKYGNHELRALEGKISRQTHILEKGMSLTNPKIGFGKEKISQLFEYLDEFKRMGYSTDSFAYKAAVGTLYSYIEYFKKRGYENKELENKLNFYIDSDSSFSGYGIKEISLNDLLEAQHKEFPDFFVSRHSVRQFSSQNVSLDLIKKAVTLATKAPSACNRQGVKVYVTDDPEKNKAFGDLLEGNRAFAQEVNKYLVIAGEVSVFSESYERNQVMIDSSLFAMSLVLALHYYGIGSCILQISERNELNDKRHKVFDIPQNEKLVLCIAIGHYKEHFQVAESNRKPVDDYLIIKH